MVCSREYIAEICGLTLGSIPPARHALRNGIRERFFVAFVDESDFRRERLGGFICSGKEYQFNIRAYRFHDFDEFVSRELHALIRNNATDVSSHDLLHCGVGVASRNDS